MAADVGMPDARDAPGYAGTPAPATSANGPNSPTGLSQGATGDSEATVRRGQRGARLRPPRGRTRVPLPAGSPGAHRPRDRRPRVEHAPLGATGVARGEG